MESIEYTKNVLNGSVNAPHDRIYYASNENLSSLLPSINMKDKKVLSVLASSDQLFHIYSQNPESVDTFDINLLTRYYYYLRKWAILYEDEYYFDVFNNEKIYNLLRKVKIQSEDEMDAFAYWNEFIRTFPPCLTNELFYRSSNPFKNKINDLKRLKEALLKYKFRFINMDISSDIVSDKYDVIVISNILEYYACYGDKMCLARDNLFAMLNSDGKILSSYYMNSSCNPTEKFHFATVFDRRELYDDNYGNIGCVYTKKRC